jgi:hypothetical protein
MAPLHAHLSPARFPLLIVRAGRIVARGKRRAIAAYLITVPCALNSRLALSHCPISKHAVELDLSKHCTVFIPHCKIPSIELYALVTT